MSSDKAFALYNLLCEDLDDADARAVNDTKSGMNRRTQLMASESLRASFLKKYEMAEAPDAEAKAIGNFLLSNETCSKWVHPRKRADVDALDLTLWGEFEGVVNNFFMPRGDDLLSFNGIVGNLEPGPGAAQGAKAGSLYHKLFASPLTTQDAALYSYYRAMCKRSPTHYSAELCRVAKYGAYTLTKGSVLETVFKKAEIRRVTCTEPSLEMMYQKAAAGLIENRLDEYFGVDLQTQPDNNRELARRGSISGHIATLDLTDASDLGSLDFMKAVIPPYSLGWLLQMRSKGTTLPSGEYVPLYMMSSMGNAFTFPLMTALFASMIKACYIVDGTKFERSSPALFRSIKATTDGLSIVMRSRRVDWAVFGDDLILPKRMVGLLTRLLRLAGYKLSPSKSFVDGDFRESCGHDYTCGHNVRGVYLRRLRTKQEFVSAYNRLLAWSCNQGIDLPRTLGFFTELPWWEKAPRVPPYEAVDAGVYSSEPPVCERSKKYQALIYRRWAPIVPKVDLTLMGDNYPDGHVVRRTERVLVESDAYAGRVKVKAFLSNHAGAEMTVIAGTAMDGRIPVRLPPGTRTKYRKVQAICSGWNRLAESALFTEVGFERFLMY